VRRAGDRSRRNGRQRSGPVRAGRVETAAEARADIQPEPARLRQLVLSELDARRQAVQHPARRNARLLAVLDGGQRGRYVGPIRRFYDRPRRDRRSIRSL